MSGVVIAFDFGLRRIGIASANLLTGTAAPIVTLNVKGEVPWRRIDDVIEDWQPDRLVVGIPESTSDDALADRVRKFVHGLEIRYKLPVATVDESLTSSAARSLIAERRRRGLIARRTRKGDLDKLAACLIAEQWMGNQQNHD